MNVSIYNCGYQHCEHSPCIFCVFQFLKVTWNKKKNCFIVKHWMSKVEWLVFLSLFLSPAPLPWATSPSLRYSWPWPPSSRGYTCCLCSQRYDFFFKQRRHLEYLLCGHRTTDVLWVCWRIVENPTECESHERDRDAGPVGRALLFCVLLFLLLPPPKQRSWTTSQDRWAGGGEGQALPKLTREVSVWGSVLRGLTSRAAGQGSAPCEPGWSMSKLSWLEKDDSPSERSSETSENRLLPKETG